ncbi:MAG: hypothetical protein DRP09_10450 [Candidatus Thorarchaeota archaeon]|nr:MAG: hypothetical protein DRP09_10450 [Candidatus Thorarchaeota archaeon]
MKVISTTIKRKWLDKIVNGEKTIELKKAKKFWRKRLGPMLNYSGKIRITFVCGQDVKRFRVERVEYHSDQAHPKDIDGELVSEWYEIHLGDEIL